MESFASLVRGEVLSVEAFDSVPEAKIVIEEWRNLQRPKAALEPEWQTPAAYAAEWRI